MKTDSPPPYTPTEAQACSAAAINKSHVLQRSLLDIIAFTYDVNYNTLDAALAGTELASTIHLNCVSRRTTTLLSATEQYRLLQIAETTARTFDNVRNRVYSMITKSDIEILYCEVVEPANRLEIWPAFVIDWLRYYPKHQNNKRKRKQTLLYQWCRPTFGWDMARLSGHLTNVDKCIPRISPNEEVTLLFAHALKRFGHGEVHQIAKLDRRYCSSDTAKEMLDEINRRVAILQSVKAGEKA